MVVYTALFGTNDVLPKPFGSGPFIAFCDFGKGDPRYTDGWMLRRPAFDATDCRRAARKHKLLSHQLFPDEDVVVWADSNVEFISDPIHLMRFLRNGICTFRHPVRNCPYAEMQACDLLKKDDPKLMKTQMRRYRQMGFPENGGLAETSVVVRENTSEIIALNDQWWNEVDGGSVRDQLSFDYCCWKLRMPYGLIPGSVDNSNFVVRRSHQIASSRIKLA